ncbi:MAG: PD-(D/E)XK nuclease family protein, partial [Bacteroidales bacterium]|nr:PD-(D/E)XK nuclease family protein [Bacteroidales bacterium]
MRQNLTDFPNRLAASNFQILHSHHKDIHFLAAPTENTSARYVTQWLESLKKQDSTLRWEEVAVVLCNESLLLPVLHSIPSVVSAINVTMGFPLMQTPISTLLVRICQLKSSETARSVKPKWQRKRVLPILQHPIVQACSPKAKQVEQDLLQNNIFFPGLEQLNKDALLQWIFRPAKNSIELATQLREILTLFSKEEMSEHHAFQSEPLFQESIFQCYLTTTTLLDILQAEMVEVDLNIFAGLLQKMMSITSIPFSGEPIQGLQIMGMLETRNLDFKHILMLSVNEGMLPKKGQDVSFIPYNLKKGFGLTTREHKDSIYAYYFMRIIQRASHLSLAYNTSTDGINPGEMSRFMLQLLVDNPNTIHRHQLSSQIGLSGPRNICIPKTNAHLRSIKKLSPSALNTYIDCSLKFYFRYIAGLKPLDQAKEDIDGATLGTVFHHAAQHIYTDLLLRKKGLNPSPSEVESSINHELNG